MTDPLRRSITPGAARVAAVIIDCVDPEQLASFWCQLLGLEVLDRLGDPPHYVDCGAIAGDAYLGFQRVEPTSAPVEGRRTHLDLAVDDLEATTSWVERNGGRHVVDVAEHGERWRVMCDPDGNEFCLWFPDA